MRVYCTVIWEATQAHLIVAILAMGNMCISGLQTPTCCISDFSYPLLQPVTTQGMAGWWRVHVIDCAQGYWSSLFLWNWTCHSQPGPYAPRGWLPLEWGQPYSGGTGKACSLHTAASGSRSSHPHKLELPHLMCLAGQRPTQRGRKPEDSWLWLPACLSWSHLTLFQVMLVSEAVTWDHRAGSFLKLFLLCLALSRTSVRMKATLPPWIRGY